MKLNPTRSNYYHCLAGAILFLMIVGCSPRIANVDLPLEDPQPFSYSGTGLVEDKWWTSFNDETLNTMIDSALQANFDLAATWQQFQASKAIVSRESADKWPQIDASAQTAKNFPEPDFAGGENTQLGLSASYEIDLWGRIRSAVQAEKYRAEVSLLDYRTAAISLAAEIANVWYQLLAARKQLQITENQIATNEDIIKLIRSRFVGGQIRAVDILRQAQLLESTREQHIIFETNVALLEHQLSVLLGKPPQQDLALPDAQLPEITGLPEAGLPLDLIRRRPDLQRSYAQLLAADRDLAAAVLNRYPRISLGARGQFRSNSFENIFDNWAYSLSGNLLAPLINGGRLKAEARRNVAIKEQRLYEYGQTALIAFREVEDGLIREIKQEERLDNIGRQLELAAKSNRQLRTEFLNGFSPYLDVLVGLDQEQQLRRDYVSGQLQQIQIRIGLYRALAGGFDTNRELEN